MSFSSHKRVVVLRGGPSGEYEQSLRTGAFILNNLPKGYEGIDVFVDKQGVWHVNGVPKSPANVVHQADIVWNATHAHVDHALHLYGAHVIGPSGMTQAAAANKVFAKQILEKAGIRIPPYTVVHKDELSREKIYEIFTTFPHPARISSAGFNEKGSGAAVISHIVTNLPELNEALGEIFSHASTALIEEDIAGRRAVSGVISGYRGQKEYALPAIEIPSHEYRIFGPNEKTEMSRMAALAHRALHMNENPKGYSQSEFIVHPRRGVFLVDADTSPVLHETSPFTYSLSLAGAGMNDVIGHMLRAVVL